tara:strand:+ start:2575 stop:3219 length:645 start_codon:yes stop_codon:yes gene_type:complete
LIPDVLRFWGASPTANDGLIWVFCIFFISYLVGSIPFGVLISKLYKLGDIRSTGSGNIGATNVLRTGSKSAAFLTLIMDIAKGSIVVFLAGEFFGITASHFAAFGVFIGHLFSIFLFFKGGKGVATFIGIQIILNIYIGIFVCMVWIFIALTTRFSSLSSLISSIFSLLILVIINDLSYVWVQTIMVLLIIISHRKNIYNLILGKESKIKLFKY